MVAVLQRRKGKPGQLRKRGNPFVRETFFAVLALLVILSIATLTSYLIADPLLHPTHHPRLIKFSYNLTHFHPRLCKVAAYGSVALLVLAQLSLLVAPLYHKYKVRKKGLLIQGDLRSKIYLNQAMQKTLPLVLPQAWLAINEIFPGLIVRAGEVHAAHWQVVSRDEGRRELQLELRYVHDPLGIKSWRLYPRRLTCTVKLRAKGVSTIAELTYKAASAMDYRTVYEIIDQTNTAVAQAKLPLELLAGIS